MDTWCMDAKRKLLQNQRLEVVRKGKMIVTSTNIMLDLGLAYFVPYESFTCLELLTAITLRHSLEGYIIRAYKEQKKGDKELDYFPNTCLDYSLTCIMNALVVPDD